MRQRVVMGMIAGLALLALGSLAWADAPPMAPSLGAGQTGTLMYSGVLYASDDGLTVNPDPGSWTTAAVRWDVYKNLAADGQNIASFTYQYTIRVASKNVSHVIFELTENSGLDVTNTMFYDYENGGWETTYAPIGSYGAGDGNSNPGWPSSDPMYGIKFEGFGKYTLNGDLVYSFRFDSLRVPQWGDVYFKDGKQPGVGWVYAYNQDMGGAVPSDLPTDWEDLYALSNGTAERSVGTSFYYHQGESGSTYALKDYYYIVRPDGYPPPEIVPEPSTGLLGGLVAVAGLACRRRRRS